MPEINLHQAAAGRQLRQSMAPEPQYTVAGIRVAEITVGAGEYAERIVRERTAPRPAPAD